MLQWGQTFTHRSSERRNLRQESLATLAGRVVVNNGLTLLNTRCSVTSLREAPLGALHDSAVALHPLPRYNRLAFFKTRRSAASFPEAPHGSAVALHPLPRHTCFTLFNTPLLSSFPSRSSSRLKRILINGSYPLPSRLSQVIQRHHRAMSIPRREATNPSRTRRHVERGPGQLDFSMPRLPLLISHTDSSNTKVKLTNGFFGNVRFVVWEKFESYVEEVSQLVRTLGPDDIREPIRDLQRCRQEIDPEKYSTTALGRGERFNEWYKSRIRALGKNSSRRLELRRLDPEDVRVGSGSRTQGSAVPGSLKQGSSAGASISPKVQSQTESHDPVQEGNSQLHVDNNRSLASTEEKGSPAYTSSSSCSSINTIVFLALQGLIRAIRGADNYFIIPQTAFSSETGWKYDNRDGAEDFLNVTPDFAMPRHPTKTNLELPYCSFELKGPAKVFWRVGPLPQAQPRQSKGKQKKGKWVLRPPNGVKQSKKKFSLGIEKPEAGQTQACSAKPKPGFKIRRLNPIEEMVASLPRTESAYRYSAKALVLFYNELFGVCRKSSFDGMSGRLGIFLPLAQTLSQGLLKQTGCCALYNHQEAVCFKIDEEVVDGEASAVVYVSRAYACDEEHGNVLALLTLMDQCVMELLEDPDLPSKMRRLYKVITEDNISPGDEKRGEHASGSSNLDDNSNAGNQPAASGTTGAPTDSQQSAVPHESDCSSNTTLYLNGDYAEEDEDVSFFVKRFSKVLKTNRGVIGSGASGIALHCTMDGERVVVKSWNGLSHGGLRAFRNEIRVYRILAARREEVLGKGIPNLKMTRIDPPESAVLVTEFVGRSVHRLLDGRLVVGEGDNAVIQEVEDTVGICEAAMRSLRLLHHCGVLHGDIELRNLRVERGTSTSETKGSSWRSWWIDLGMARDGIATDLERELEVALCSALFPEVEHNITISAE